MVTKNGFSKLTINEFEEWISKLRIGRTILKIQQHHTYSPSYIHFNGTNHFERQLAMKNFHIHQNGWRDIGQHFTIFPDGTVMTGRSLELSPACITYQNANSICIENFGNFDLNGDVMNTTQKVAIIAITASLCKKFNLPVNSNSIVYHHWFRLDNGFRNNGVAGNKSCPGTNFFGGNKVVDFERNFAPLLIAKLANGSLKTDTTSVLKYVSVLPERLNIRSAPFVSSPKAKERSNVEMGSILRVYDERNNWYKISNTMEHWVAAKFAIEVIRATVVASFLNVRTGPGPKFPKTSGILKGEVIFVYEQAEGWCKIGMDDRWVNKQYLLF